MTLGLESLDLLQGSMGGPKAISIKRGTAALLFVLHQLRSLQRNLPLEPLLSASRFSHPHLPVALRRLGRAGRGAGEPGLASWVAASRTQHGPRRGGHPPLPWQHLSLPAVPEPARGA